MDGTSRDFLRLVADNDDDSVSGDKTVLVELGDKIDIVYAGRATVSRRIFVGRPTSNDSFYKNNDPKSQLKHDIREVQVRFSVMKDDLLQTAVISEEKLNSVVLETNKILAQATLRLKVQTLGLGTGLAPPASIETNWRTGGVDIAGIENYRVTNDEIELWRMRPQNSGNVVDVFVIPGLSKPGHRAVSFFAGWVNSSANPAAAAGKNCIFLTAGDITAKEIGQVLAHELGHILINVEHGGQKWDLMHAFEILTESERPNAKRIKPSQEDDIGDVFQTTIMRAGANNLPQ